MFLIKRILVAVTLGFALISCAELPNDNTDLININDITGVYEGKLTETKSGGMDYPATVTIRRMDNNTIEMTMDCEIMDTTIVYDVYHNNDSLMVCLTGDDFENHYGHKMRGMHHNMGMNDDDGNDWMHHMDEEHSEGDQHFGSFSMMGDSFHCNFYDDDNDNNNNLIYEFDGRKRK